MLGILFLRGKEGSLRPTEKVLEEGVYAGFFERVVMTCLIGYLPVAEVELHGPAGIKGANRARWLQKISVCCNRIWFPLVCSLSASF